ncbi:MAG: dimethylargininase [Polaribacter sp.]|jgi:dimethylargininase
MFSKALVRQPGKSLVDGITTSELGAPDYELAMKQHDRYIDALKLCGLEVTVMPADEDYPDGLFIEDVALVMPGCAVSTRPGASARRGEVDKVASELGAFYDKVEAIDAPGTLDAGDIMMVGKHFYIGLSERSNQAGAAQLIEILKAHGYSGSMVAFSEALHLKSSVSYLEDNRLVITGELCAKPEFAEFDQIEIDADEAYAANCVWINNRVLVASGYPKTSKAIADLGYQVIELDVSELRKLDGGLSCLSLRF